jgi:DNA invertase Pin-like site-specific DNA recombinase
MDGRFVAYLRVSTKRQETSGLGMEAQEKAIADYLNGGRWELVGRFEEAESGKRNDRPELMAAIQKCKATGAKLLIAKIDRLARNVAFVSNLMESGVEFVAADFPQANRLTVHIMAAMAEYEREMISKRVRDALAMAKKRGVKMGNPHTHDGLPKGAAEKGAAASIKVRTKKADEHARRLHDTIKQYQAGGMSLRVIARKLTEDNILTPRGKGSWEAVTVQRVLKRVEEQENKE